MSKLDYAENFVSRNANYDILRIVSTVMVILIHANYKYFCENYMSPTLTFEWVIESLINIVTRFSVPCFLMISGAFILNDERNSNALYFYKKSSYKIFLPAFFIICFILLYSVGANIYMRRNVFRGFGSIIDGTFYNLWYIYMLAGIYFFAPFIIRLKMIISMKKYYAVTLVMIVWGGVSQFFSTYRASYCIGVCVAYTSFFMAGDVIRQLTDMSLIKSNKITKLIFVCICCICISISFLFRYMGFNYYISDAFVSFFSPLIIIYSIIVFSLFGTYDFKPNKRICYISRLTFYIYLFHTLILSLVNKFICKLRFSEVAAAILATIITFFLSLFVSVVFDKLWNTFTIKLNLMKKWYSMGIWKYIGNL